MPKREFKAKTEKTPKREFKPKTGKIGKREFSLKFKTGIYGIREFKAKTGILGKREFKFKTGKMGKREFSHSKVLMRPDCHACSCIALARCGFLLSRACSCAALIFAHRGHLHHASAWWTLLNSLLAQFRVLAFKFPFGTFSRFGF